MSDIPFRISPAIMRSGMKYSHFSNLFPTNAIAALASSRIAMGAVPDARSSFTIMMVSSSCRSAIRLMSCWLMVLPLGIIALISKCQGTIATGLTHPALALLILTGKQHTVKPWERPIAERFASFSV